MSYCDPSVFNIVCGDPDCKPCKTADFHQPPVASGACNWCKKMGVEDCGNVSPTHTEPPSGEWEERFDKATGHLENDDYIALKTLFAQTLSAEREQWSISLQAYVDAAIDTERERVLGMIEEKSKTYDADDYTEAAVVRAFDDLAVAISDQS